MSNLQTNGKYYFSYYTNINGQEQRIEKEFDSKDDYDHFLKENNFKMPSFNFSLPGFFTNRLPQWITPLDRFGEYRNTTTHPALGTSSHELEELKRKKVEREHKKSHLEILIKDAQELVTYFEKEGDKTSAQKAKDLVKQYQDAIKGD